MSDTDQLKPFAIKSIPTRVAEEITEAARTSTPKVTVGQLIEKVWAHWQGSEQPTLRLVDGDGEELGMPMAWHIRSMPENIRRYYTNRAHAEGCTMAELLTRMARSQASPMTDAPSTTSLAEITALLHAAAALAAAGVPLPRELRRLISDLARGARPALSASHQPAEKIPLAPNR